MSNLIELEACPFCGNKEGEGMGVRPGTDLVYCQCGALKPLQGWNLRPLEDALRGSINQLRARIEELEAAYQSLREYCDCLENVETDPELSEVN